ncbi:MAG: type II toxin-antitoxin system VapC family toxin [Verrucomicrobia bacterium]|nr:type II toxin-antitoxin system VapC family toxin [Verrucomicrobiota bacterium]MCH8512822.1 type II toxin-antitoxin system VapC family toxin [Kiritimatiellia bacterium]
MTSVDTNLLVRFLTRDDEAQFEKAYRVFQMEEVFLAVTVILETEWVLRYAYDFPREEILVGFRKLLGLENVYCAQPEVLRSALLWFEKGLDFADALHLANSRHCEVLKSFDKSFVKKGRGLSPCAVEIPV